MTTSDITASTASGSAPASTARTTPPNATGIWALIPLKPLEFAKQRLRDVLQPQERRRLMEAMLRDVVTALKKTRGIAGILLVSRAQRAVALAKELGVAHWRESESADLSGAVFEASAWLVTTHAATGTLILPGDLPLVSAAEIEDLLAVCRGRDPALVLAPDRHRQGTNGILSCPANLIPYQYDGHSYAPHLAAARARCIDVVTPIKPGLGLDIDHPADLIELLSRTTHSNGSATMNYLNRSGIASRLRQPHAEKSASQSVG